MARKPRTPVEKPLRNLPDLQVRPLAPDVFVGAQGVSGAGRGLLDLADALSGLSNTTGAIAKLQQKRQQEQNQLAFEKLPRTDKVAAIAQGYGPNGSFSPLDPGSAKIAGRAAGATVVEEAEKELAGMDLGDPGFDADRWATERFAPTYKQYENDHYVTQGVHDEFIKFRSSLEGRQAKARLKAAYDGQNQSVYQGLRQEFADAKAAGLNDEQLYEVILGNEKALRNNPLFRSEMLTGKDWNDQLLSMAKDLAEEHPKIALRLLQEPRTGSDGKVVGPLMLIQDNAEAAKSIQEKALVSLKNENERTIADNVAATALAKGLNGEHIGAIKDIEHMPEGVKDERLKISVKGSTIKKALEQKYDAFSAGEAARLKENPTETLGREINQRAQMGLVNEGWKEMLKSSVEGISERSLQDPNSMQALQASWQLYSSLRQTKPHFLQAHMDKPTADFYDMAYMARKYGVAKSDDDAFLMAMRARDVNDTDPDQMKVRGEVKRILDSDYGNQQDVYRHLSEAAQVYVRMGIGPKQAVKFAQEKLDINGAEVNGWYVPIPTLPSGEKAFVPDKWPEAAELLIEKWYDKHGSPEYKPSELTLTTTSDGTYTIVRKADGSQVYGLNINGEVGTAIPFFTANDFVKVTNEREAVAANDQKAEAIAQQDLNSMILSGDYRGFIDKRVGENAHWQQQIIAAFDLVTRKAYYRRHGISLGNPLQTYTDAASGKKGVALFTAPEALERKGHRDVQYGLQAILPKSPKKPDKDSDGNSGMNIAP